MTGNSTVVVTRHPVAALSDGAYVAEVALNRP
ncbi:enoyl-CoA hydratase/isomerase family protein, partial [Streptomyces sp. SID5910]|nr:enoyl-CoA hydratase/isomerase family protein [Streptomyces sp. SID5910]